jgi:hypothetical protein
MIFESKIGFNAQRALDYYMGNKELYMADKTNGGILKLALPHIFDFTLFNLHKS